MSAPFVPFLVLLAHAPEAVVTVPTELPVVQTAPLTSSESVPPVVAPPPLVTTPAAIPEAIAPDPNQIIVTARPASTPGDPFLGANAVSFSAVQSVDRAFVGPVSMAYQSVLPRPVRGGLRNFLSNLQEPVIALNYLLQIKPGKALKTIGRFTVNSTIGVGGLIDIAKKRPFNGPHRTNGFAYTLGYYGVKSGPYLFLPLIGPTTLRDVIGRVIDLLVLPSAFGKPFNRPAYSVSTTIIRSLDERAEADGQLRAMLKETSDPYGAIRDSYLQKRQSQLDELRGKPAQNSKR